MTVISTTHMDRKSNKKKYLQEQEHYTVTLQIDFNTVTVANCTPE